MLSSFAQSEVEAYSCNYPEAEGNGTFQTACVSSLDIEGAFSDEFGLQWGSDPAFATGKFIPPYGQGAESQAINIWEAYTMAFFGFAINTL
jgi:hypothetical protein